MTHAFGSYRCTYPHFNIIPRAGFTSTIRHYPTRSQMLAPQVLSIPQRLAWLWRQCSMRRSDERSIGVGSLIRLGWKLWRSGSSRSLMIVLLLLREGTRISGGSRTLISYSSGLHLCRVLIMRRFFGRAAKCNVIVNERIVLMNGVRPPWSGFFLMFLLTQQLLSPSNSLTSSHSSNTSLETLYTHASAILSYPHSQNYILSSLLPLCTDMEEMALVLDFASDVKLETAITRNITVGL